jgi:hypothetical protein
MRKRKCEIGLSIIDWLWEIWSGNRSFGPWNFIVPFVGGTIEDIEKEKINGNVVVKAADDFALVFRSKEKIPTEKDITTPLSMDYFFMDTGGWDDNAIWGFLNAGGTCQSHNLIKIIKI